MSSSILTNQSAQTALLALNATQQSMNKFENQISTGLAISSASDNASYWSIASSMTSDTSALGAVSGALSETSSILSTSTAAMQSTISIMNQIKDDLTTASNPGANFSALQTDITAQQQLLLSIGNSANFNGINLLTNSQTTSSASAPTTLGTANFVASYNSNGGTGAVSYISIDASTTELFDAGATNAAGATGGILGAVGSNATSTSILGMNITTFNGASSPATAGDIANLLADVETAINSINTAAATIGGAQTNVTDQQTFISNLSSSLTTGVGALVDADMNQASTKISALQVQQQLGVQALSIANTNTQLILKLFQ